MKKIIFSVLLVGAIIVSAYSAFGFSFFTNAAALILNSSDAHTLERLVISNYNKTVAEDQRLQTNTSVHIEFAYINNDTRKDVIATLESGSTCGTGGCMTRIMLTNDSGAYDEIQFNYAVKSIDVQGSLTNEMHDLQINGDSQNLMRWDGKQYTLNTI